MDSEREQFEKWMKTQPFCLSGDECDGDLVAEPHEPACPMSKIEGSAGRSTMLTFFDCYAAGRLAQREQEEILLDKLREIKVLAESHTDYEATLKGIAIAAAIALRAIREAGETEEA